METVKGDWNGEYDNKRGGFVYVYCCPECKRLHTSTSPEVTVPALCCDCVDGGQFRKFKKEYKRLHGKQK